MARPKVIQELTRHLAALLETALRPGADGAGGASPAAIPPRALAPPGPGGAILRIAHPGDLEQAPDLPAAGLYLYETAPEARWRPLAPSAEPEEGTAARPSLQDFLRRPPLWITCRYALSFRARDPLEEQELAAAALQALHDHPLVPAEALPSLGGEGWNAAGADRFPVSIRSDPELWKALGLARHRLLVPFEATVPLPSSRREPARRVLERLLEIDVLEEREESGEVEP
jgi:hypothetical protein